MIYDKQLMKGLEASFAEDLKDVCLVFTHPSTGHKALVNLKSVLGNRGALTNMTVYAWTEDAIRSIKDEMLANQQPAESKPGSNGEDSAVGL